MTARALWIVLAVTLVSSVHAQPAVLEADGALHTAYLDAGTASTWSFAAEAGQTYRVEIRTESYYGLDSKVEVFSPDGTSVGTDDDSGEYYGSKFEFTAATTGLHDVVVEGFNGSSAGPYTLVIARLGSPAQPEPSLEPASSTPVVVEGWPSVRGTWENVTAHQGLVTAISPETSFALEVEEGVHYAVWTGTLGDGMDSVLEVRDASDLTLLENDDTVEDDFTDGLASAVVFRATRSARVHLAVRHFRDDATEGSYVLSVERFIPTETPTPSDEPVAQLDTEYVTSMHRPRAGHQALLLADGRVLVVGGVGPDHVATETIELFDPLAEAWTELDAGTLLTDCAATLLPDGRVLIVGGVEVNAFQTVVASRRALLFDPLTDTLTPSAGQLQQARRLPFTEVLPDGRVLVLGGADIQRYVRTAEVFDPRSETFALDPSWGGAAPIPGTGRLTRLGDSLALLGGRAESADRPVSPSFFWNVGVRAAIDDLPLTWHAATPLGDHLVLTGGIHRDHPNAGLIGLLAEGALTPRWIGALRHPRANHTATTVRRDRVCVVGGIHLQPRENNLRQVGNAELIQFDLDGARVIAEIELTFHRTAHTTTLLHDGSLLIVGGALGGEHPNGQDGLPMAQCERIVFPR